MKKSRILSLCQCALFAALLCILSPLSIPIGPIPITLALFVVMLCAVVLGSLRGAAAVAVYLLLGALGLPVFSGAVGGVSRLLGPTGGFFWGYLLCALIIGLRRFFPSKRFASEAAIAFLFCLLGLSAAYLCGSVQYALYAKLSLSDAVKVAVLPFIALDLIKCAGAAVFGVLLRRTLKKADLL